MDYIPICDGEAHLQNIVNSNYCYVCSKVLTKDMVLIKVEQKEYKFACLDHPGITQEFLRQYKRAPLGWTQVGGDQNEMGQTLRTNEGS